MIEAVELATGADTALTDDGSEKQDPTWSEDGTEIVYTEQLPDGGTTAAGPRSGIRRLKVNLPRRPGATSVIPRRYELHQNVPNPFDQRTAIRFAVPTAGRVNVQVYDLSGRVVRELVNDDRRPGFYTVTWDAYDNAGRRVPAGVYFYELRAADKSIERKMLYLK